MSTADGIPDRFMNNPPKGLRIFNVGKSWYGLDLEDSLWWIVYRSWTSFGKEYAPGFYRKPWGVMIGTKFLTRAEVIEFVGKNPA